MGNYHAGFGPADEGLSTPKKLAASASSDWNVALCRTREQAELALTTVAQTLNTLLLSLEPTKTAITSFDEGFEYLGCYFKGQNFYFTYKGQWIKVDQASEWQLFVQHGPQGYE